MEAQEKTKQMFVCEIEEKLNKEFPNNNIEIISRKNDLIIIVDDSELKLGWSSQYGKKHVYDETETKYSDMIINLIISMVRVSIENKEDEA